jgi:uncharacterized protein (TIGR00106 family)
MGTDNTSASLYIARGIKAIQNFEGIRYQVTAMGTILESEEIDKIFAVSKKIMEAVHMMGVKRVEVVLKIDSRKDKSQKLEEKLDSLNRHLKSG